MNIQEFITQILKLHKNIITTIVEFSSSNTGISLYIEKNHFYNSTLWLTEDKARRDDKGFEFVYKAKRDIDTLNQKRNDAISLIDETLYEILKPAALGLCPINSETPGMIIDRLSILALKEYHMTIQTKRQDANTLHISSCLTKLEKIKAQKQILILCLKEFLEEIINKTRTFISFNAFKMYNDPSLNPELYNNII